jgi:pantoate kinase
LLFEKKKKRKDNKKRGENGQGLFLEQHTLVAVLHQDSMHVRYN